MQEHRRKVAPAQAMPQGIAGPPGGLQTFAVNYFTPGRATSITPAAAWLKPTRAERPRRAISSPAKPGRAGTTHTWPQPIETRQRALQRVPAAFLDLAGGMALLYSFIHPYTTDRV